MEELKRERLARSARGAATGNAIAVTPAWSAPLIGPNPALALLAAIALIATFLMIRGWAQMLINPGAMLFLTVTTILQIAAAGVGQARGTPAVPVPHR